MANAKGIQQTLQEFLEPIYDQAKKNGELYLNMSYAEITKWLFRVVVSEIALATYESREVRKAFLLKMFSPSINAKKAKAYTTIENIHASHLR